MLNRLRGLLDDITSATDQDGPKRRDYVLVALFLALTALEIIVGVLGDDDNLPISAAITSTVGIAVIPWRRVLPAVAIVPVLAQVTFTIIAEVEGVEAYITAGLLLATIVSIYAVARWLPVRRAAIILGIIVLVDPVADLLNQGRPIAELSGRPIAIGLLVALAAVARYRATLAEQRIEEVRLLERHELARELHDVIAHHVSAIAVQAQAGGAVAAANPSVAQEVLGTIEEQASLALAEMRRMVGILRSDDNRQPHASLESFRGLATPGPPVVAVEVQADHELPSSVLAAAYRIAQESVTNARRHAEGVARIDVSLRSDDDQLELVVTNDGRTVSHIGSDGYGQVGMKERATALDGTLESGPRMAGGWQVRAEIPIEGTRR